ncbi:DUF1223 domain-containing protein [Nonlabens ponticola]|nr:DUF1223 domain-containing protein [Nonlabens ponticola]
MAYKPLTRTLMPIISMLCAFGILAFQHNENHDQDNSIVSQPVVQVVELFTSQGCSSCPPADKLLGTITDKENVIALSYHVDYWNRLGWKDQFSDSQFSTYQRNYAKALRSRVYTPQMVVNGSKEFVGSKSIELKKNLNSKSMVDLLTKPEVSRESNQLIAQIDLTEAPKYQQAYALAVLDKHVTQVTRGENAQKQLINSNIVIDRKALNSTNANITFDLPDDLNGSYRIAIILQDDDLNIVGAAMSDAY